MEGKKPKVNIFIKILMVLLKKTYQERIAIGNSSGLLFSWKCPRVMKFMCNIVPFAS